MTNSCLPLSIFGFVLPILLIFSGGILRPVNGQAPGQGAWCISQPSASEQALMENINYACKMVDCSTIQPGGLCYYPGNHASLS
ncbi:UNVERIFIED_CONTAM: hypothetical protein Sradi_5396400 [Sesamum radiatum]|uniref:X8 domain-containing protein n=1 Tax=Sesamum radiatum TaxID=300843 RepID=A0AAW2LQ87_SESRA